MEQYLTQCIAVKLLAVQFIFINVSIQIQIGTEQVCIQKMSSSRSSSRHDKKSKSPSLSTKGPSRNKIFITNLNPKTSDLEQKVRNMIEKFGTVLSIQCRKSPNQCYSFAFVELKQYQAVQKVLKLNGEELDGRKIKIQYQKSPQPQDRPKPYIKTSINDGQRPRGSERQGSSRKQEKMRHSRSKSNGQKKPRHHHNQSPQRHKDRRRDRSDSRHQQKDRMGQSHFVRGRPQPGIEPLRYYSHKCYTCGSSSHRSRDCPRDSRRRYDSKRDSRSISESSQSHKGRRQRRRSVTRSRDKKKRRHHESSDSYSRDRSEEDRRRPTETKSKKDNHNSSRYSRYD